jgi:hypothetical protein
MGCRHHPFMLEVWRQLQALLPGHMLAWLLLMVSCSPQR